MTIHELKTWPVYFEALERGEKRFEIRRDDRGFEVGDTLRLRNFDPERDDYLEGELHFRVTYIMRGPAFGLPAGFVIMSLV